MYPVNWVYSLLEGVVRAALENTIQHLTSFLVFFLFHVCSVNKASNTILKIPFESSYLEAQGLILPAMNSLVFVYSVFK